MKRLVKYLVILVLILFSASLVGYFMWQAFKKKELANSLYEAETYFKENKFSEAKTALRKVLKQDFHSEKGTRLSAEIAEKELNFQLAALLWKRVISLNPLDESVHYRYAAALNASKNFAAALKYLENRQKSSGFSAGEMMELVRARLETGEYPGAKRMYQELDKTLVNPDDYNLLAADMFLLDNNREEAKKQYVWLAGQAEKPTVKFSALLRVAMFAEKDQREKYLLQAADTFPLLGNAVLADFYLGGGRFKEAIDILEKVPDSERSLLHLRQLGEAYASLNRVEEIETFCGKMHTSSRESAVLKYYLEALAAYLRKDYPKAMDKLGNCQDFFNRSLYNYIRLETGAKLFYPSKELIGTADRLRNTAAESKSATEKQIVRLLLPTVRHYVEKNRYEDAIRMAEYLLGLDRTLTRLENVLLFSLFRGGRLEQKNLDLAQRILKRDPKDKNALFVGALLALSGGDPAAAGEYAQRLLEVTPDAPEALMLLGAVEERRKNPAGAETYYRKAFTIRPKNVETADRLFGFLLNQKTDKVADFAEDAVKKNPELRARAWFYRGMAEWKMNRKTEAAACLQSARRAGLKLPYVYLALSRLSETSEDREKYLKEGLKNFPGNGMLRVPLAALYASGNREKEAAALYAEQLKSTPNDPLLLINYSEVLAVLGRSAEAMEMAVQAKNLASADPRVKECYAIREFEQKNYPQTILELEPLMKNRPVNARVTETLAKALLEDGKSRMEESPMAARARFNRALELKPGWKEAQEALRRLNGDAS